MQVCQRALAAARAAGVDTLILDTAGADIDQLVAQVLEVLKAARG